MFRPRRLLPLLALAALMLGVLAPGPVTRALDPTATPAPSVPAGGDCGATPVIEYTIDLAASAPFSPMVQFRENGMALPAAGRFYWGNGQYGIANLNQVGGGNEFFKQVQPIYSTPGEYNFNSNITDACGTVFSYDYPLAVPLTLPTTLTLPCPGTTDVSGFCLVALGQKITFTIGGGPDTGWRWDATGPPGGRTLTRSFDTLGEFWIQARVVSKDGMIVSPLLKVAPTAPSRPRITEYQAPDEVDAGADFTASFTVPAGAEQAKPSIYADAKQVSDTTSAQLSFAAGTHVITFVLTYPDDSTVSRQVGVVSLAPPPPPPEVGPNPLLLLAGILAGGLALGFLILALLLLARRLRRRRVDNLLAARSRWLAAVLRSEGWLLEGPTRLDASEDEPARTLLTARHARGEFVVARPLSEEKWLWQDLLVRIAADFGGVPLESEEEDERERLDQDEESA